jgi:hypothetical protein
VLQGTLIADIALGAVFVEIIILLALRRWPVRKAPPIDLLFNAVSGAFLMLALRAALAGSDPYWIALCAAGAGLSHIAAVVWR